MCYTIRPDIVGACLKRWSIVEPLTLENIIYSYCKLLDTIKILKQREKSTMHYICLN